MTKTVDGTWVSYSVTARIDLAIVLVAVAAGMVYPGTRLRQPVRLPRPGETATGIMVMAWVLAIVAFLACATQYVSAMRQHHLLHRLPPHPITRVAWADPRRSRELPARARAARESPDPRVAEPALNSTLTG